MWWFGHTVQYRVGCVQFCQSHESEALEQHLTDQTPFSRLADQ